MPIKDPIKRKEYQKQYFQKWYEKNKTDFKQKVVKATKKHRHEMTDWLNDYKSHCSCLLCGENDSICLDFHHINGEKDFNIRDYRQQEWMTPIKFLIELEKCVVLCANCHRKTHKYKDGDIFLEVN